MLQTVFQTNGQCNSFNSIEQLKSRPAHLAAFLHYVISQFDPAPVVRSSAFAPHLTPLICVYYASWHHYFFLTLCLQLCYLYADLYKQTNSKDTRRVFMALHTFFIDRGAVSAVMLPIEIHGDTYVIGFVWILLKW